MVANVLGVVVARGGSKGLARKNVLQLGGKPLVAHTVAAALGARRLGRTIVSSDDPEILAAARAAGGVAPFVRPRELAGDRSSTVDVGLHALDWLEKHERYAGDVLVLLPATAPLRTAQHIDDAVARLLDDDTIDAVVAVTEAEYPPWWMFVIDGDRLRWLFAEGARADHRQELPRAFRPNGSIYAIRVSVLRRDRTYYPPSTAPYLMPRDSSVNVDSADDLRLAEWLLAAR
ncbi:MAG: acylneuraminate cytidylyltransferase family protein [Candidatus Rokubacteria bacterium]|nr:acylneuraminate cytidylyltransferase family protein [Candidatus Rokubacteria bacterium]